MTAESPANTCVAWTPSPALTCTDPTWEARMREIYDDLLEEIDGGSMWEPYTQTIKRLGGKAVGGVKKRLQAKSAAS